MPRVHVAVYDHTGLIGNIITNRRYGESIREVIDHIYEYIWIYEDMNFYRF